MCLYNCHSWHSVLNEPRTSGTYLVLCGTKNWPVASNASASVSHSDFLNWNFRNFAPSMLNLLMRLFPMKLRIFFATLSNDFSSLSSSSSSSSRFRFRFLPSREKVPAFNVKPDGKNKGPQNLKSPSRDTEPLRTLSSSSKATNAHE